MRLPPLRPAHGSADVCSSSQGRERGSADGKNGHGGLSDEAGARFIDRCVSARARAALRRLEVRWREGRWFGTWWVFYLFSQRSEVRRELKKFGLPGFQSKSVFF